jgi:hypothetical protein
LRLIAAFATCSEFSIACVAIHYKQPVSSARKRAVSIVFANDRTNLSTWCSGYIASSW